MAKTLASPLTETEREVLLAASRGWDNERVGEYLDMSPNTVRTHRANITRKLKCHTMLAAVAIGLRNGWIR
jgi:DNA-binding NarL/FixJ family response regulator